ncbi:hypothetical protein O7602_12840 [Micromonospora sp. WMMD1128]|uniref:hypothetical protein n=1 Tax=Micromonospora sp. WMMD1128 TaxID=3015150 RepID=UPI00248B9B1A|nr:hypothetical protein [Micromonospora sp. WMMD1128]WBB76356.1 hypothetical protein O7602_12840 [Micromonospora sp. WMMD1128]
MPALRRIAAATVLAGAVSASVLVGGPAQAAETRSYVGLGLNNNYFTALYYATNDAWAQASADGFDPATQCSPGGNFATQPWPGLYQVRALVNCTR